MTSLGIVAATDAAQEELIGKVVNLTKVDVQGNSQVTTSINGFTIIVLAQTIKDVGGAGVDISMTKYAPDGTTDETKTDCRIGTFDAVTTADPNASVYFDEITAEQKIMVKGRMVNGEVIIKSFQYLE
jgi:hypothetical protein